MSTPPNTAAVPPVADAPDDALPVSFSLDISSVLALLPDDAALDDWFLSFCAQNDDLGYDFEIDQKGRLLAMASEGLDGLHRLGNVYLDLRMWADEVGGGMAVPGNGLVHMSERGRRAPDAAWISPDQLETLPPAGQRPGGVPFTPLFIAEIVSRSDRLADQQAKMAMWIDSGAQLGWLIDPFQRQAHIYFTNAEPVLLNDPEIISGEPALPGFVFNVRSRIFDLH